MAYRRRKFRKSFGRRRRRKKKYISQKSQRRHKAKAHRLVKKTRAGRRLKKAIHYHIKKS